MTRKPKLGQNFLADPSAARAIVDALGELTHRDVLEIGPGGGAITEILAARARRLIAVEIDHDLALQLRVHFEGNDKVEIIEQDILRLDLASLPHQGKLAVVGNLPYYITSDILLRLFAFHGVVSQAILMVQREVADRVAATPGTRDYGLLSATAQLYARIERLFTLPPEAFSPPPDVFSTVLRITMQPRFEALEIEAAAFIEFLKKCFAQKRKTLANNLRSAGYSTPQILATMEESGVPPQTRAESIPLEQAAALYRALLAQASPQQLSR